MSMWRKKYTTPEYPGKMETEKYVYTPGLHGLEFFKTLKEKDAIVATKCGETLYIPPTTLCPDFSKGEVVEVPLTNPWYIASYTIVYEDMDGNKLDKPQILALLVPEEDIVGGIIHYVKAEPEEIDVGLMVKAKLKPREKREGKITDIEYFELVA